MRQFFHKVWHSVRDLGRVLHTFIHTGHLPSVYLPGWLWPGHRRTTRRPAMAATATTQASESEALHYVPLDLSKCHDQQGSPLFTVVPPEIRNRIFEFALSNYEDSSAAYSTDTCYRRPGYTAPHKTSTALLQTCQLIYREAWFRPWTQALITMFLTSPDRKPEKTTSTQELKRNLELIHAFHDTTEVAHVRVFAQLYALESGRDLTRIL